MRKVSFRPRVVDAPYRFHGVSRQNSYQFGEANNKVHEWNKKHCPYLKEGGYTCAICRLQRPYLWDKCHRIRMGGIGKDEGH